MNDFPSAAEEGDAPEAEAKPRVRRHRASRRKPQTPLGRHVAAFLVAGGIPAFLACNGAGFGIVLRQQTGAIIWSVLALAVLFGVLPGNGLSRRLRFALFALLALAVWTLIGMSWTSSQERTFAELAREVTYGGYLLLLAFTVGRRTWITAAIGLFAGLLTVCTISLAARFAPELFTRGDLALQAGSGRLGFPLDYWNALAAWAGMTFALALGWSGQSRFLALRRVAAGSLPLSGLVVYLTYSRAGVALCLLSVLFVCALSKSRWTVALHGSVAVGVTALTSLVASGYPSIASGSGTAGRGVVFLALAASCAACVYAAIRSERQGLDRYKRPRRTGTLTTRKAIVAGTVVVALLIVPLAMKSVESFAGYGETTSQISEAAANQGPERLITLSGSRSDLWGAALDAARDRPIEGIGAGTYEFWWNVEGKGSDRVQDAHSLYLEVLGEQGLVGFALLLAFLGILVSAAVGARRMVRLSSEMAAVAGLLGAGTVFLVQSGVDWLWENPAVVFAGLGAMVIASAPATPHRRGGWFPGWARLATVVLAVGFALVQIPGIVSTQRATASGQEYLAGHPEEAIGLADDAIKAESFSASAYALKAEIERLQDQTSDALRDANKAIGLEPTNWNHRLLLARIEAEAGNPAGVSSALDEAARLRPADQGQIDGAAAGLLRTARQDKPAAK